MNPGRDRWVILAILFLVGIAMRTQLLSIGPLLPRISTDLAIPHAVGGLLVAMPVLCMAAVAIPASLVADRIGAVNGVLLCLVLLAVAGVLRSLAPEPAAILLFTVPIGIAIGLGGSLFAVVAKERLPDEPAVSTSAYVTGFVLGSTIASAAAVPLADLLGSWRGPLALFALVTGLLAAVWALAFRRRPPSARRGVRLPRPPWRRPVAWLIVAVFGLQSLIFYCFVTWLPAFYVERGWSDQAAGLLLALFIGIGLPTTLVIGAAADRWGSRRQYLAAAAIATLVGVVGINVLPDLALVWVSAVGFGLGVIFPVGLTLPLDVAADSFQVAGYVGLTLAFGYLLSGIAPFVLGALRDALGSFAASMPMVIVFALALQPVVAFASPARLAAERASTAVR